MVPFRVALMIILLVALVINFFLENPSSSTILLHPQLKWAFDLLKEAGCEEPWCIEFRVYFVTPYSTYTRMVTSKWLYFASKKAPLRLM